MVSFRVSPAVLERLNRLTDKVTEKYPAYNRSDILREIVTDLLGVETSGVVMSMLREMAQGQGPERRLIKFGGGIKQMEDPD